MLIHLLKFIGLKSYIRNYIKLITNMIAYVLLSSYLCCSVGEILGVTIFFHFHKLKKNKKIDLSKTSFS